MKVVGKGRPQFFFEGSCQDNDLEVWVILREVFFDKEVVNAGVRILPAHENNFFTVNRQELQEKINQAQMKYEELY